MDAVGRVRRVRLERAQVVPDLVADHVGAAEVAAVAEDQRELAAEVVEVRLAAGAVEQRGALAAGARRRRAVEPDEEVLASAAASWSALASFGATAKPRSRRSRRPRRSRGARGGRERGELVLGERQPHLRDVELPRSARGADVEADRAAVLALDQGRGAEGVLLELGAERREAARPVRGCAYTAW